MKKKRVYISKVRETKASQTKFQILNAAKELFHTKGFDRVTIEMVAKAAGVSIPTVYALFKSKRGLLQSLIDDALPTEQFTDLVDSSMNEQSARKRLSITAKLSRKIYDAEKELVDLLHGVSVLSPEFKELEKEREQRRYERQGAYIKKLMQDKVIANKLTIEKARDILWSLTGRDMYRMLVIERAWSSDEYEKWLEKILVQSLLTTDVVR